MTIWPFSIKSKVSNLYLWAWEKSSPLAVLLVLLILIYGAWRGHQKIREDLRYALLDASADVSHLFLNYQAARSFNSREILELSMQDLQDARASWGPVSSNLFLQAIDKEGHSLYDSRSHTIETDQDTLAASSRLVPGLFQFLDSQILHLDQEVTEEWVIRTAITGKDYLLAQVKGILTFTLPFSLIIVGMLLFPYFYREAISGHQFEMLISTVLSVPQTNKTEADLVGRLPEFVRIILGFDAVAIYLREGDAIVLRNVDSVNKKNSTALLQAIQEHPITIHSPYPEAVAVRENRSILLPQPGKHKDIHRPMLEAWGDAPYIIAPIHDPKKSQVIGLLTAEKKTGLHKKDQEALVDLAKLVMVLIENVRFSARLEESYRRMVRQTRQVALGTVVPIIAHNLRTPLTMTSMIADDLTEKWTRIEPEVISRRLAQIKTQASQCLALIDRINQYRKMGVRHKNTRGERPVLDLHDVLDKVYKFFESYFEIRQIRLVFCWDNGFRPVVAMEELDLLQVLTNLLINADEAFPDKDRANAGYEVKIHVERSPESPGALIRISDNGPGVPPELREKIFREDFTTKEDGTGAGLPYCRSIIHSAHGWLELEPEAKQGASFSIFLPTETR